MIFSFSPLVTVILDILLWAVIHLGVAYTMISIPYTIFEKSFFLFNTFPGETRTLYRKTGINYWKKWLPEGASILRKGFLKNELTGTSEDYFKRFIAENNRGELTHWIVFLCSGIFFIFNPLWAGWVMVVYAFFANFPCILTQRYNRIRMQRILNSRYKKR